MKVKLFFAVVATGAIASFGTACTVREVNANPPAELQEVQTTTSPTKQAEADEQEVQFICRDGYDPQSKQRVPTTFAWTPRGKIAIVRWKSDWAQEAGYSPQVRCDEVSPRFDAAYKNGSLEYLTNGRKDNQKVICTASEPGGACNTVILTLRPEDKELVVLRQLNDILQGGSGGPIEQSSGQLKHPDGTPKVYKHLDIETFLRTAPVEPE